MMINYLHAHSFESSDKFLVATTQHLLIATENHQFFKVHSGSGLYFGLASDGKKIYVACQNEVDYRIRPQKNGKILVFDAFSLNMVGELAADFELRDMHGMAYFDQKLWITCSYDNLVAVYNFAENTWTKWYPSTDPKARDQDVNHFNTIELVDNQICIVAHNHGVSDFLFYDRLTLQPISVFSLGRQAHNIFSAKGALATCNSAQGMIINKEKWALRTGGFPRGLAEGKHSIWLGISEFLPRGDRANAAGILRRYTLDWDFAADYVLPEVGGVLAILPITPNLTAIENCTPFLDVKQYFGKYNELIPGNTYVPGTINNYYFAEKDWYEGEVSHRWSAVKQAHVEIVINSGETELIVQATSGYDGAYSAEVFLNGLSLGSIQWTQPGVAYGYFKVPSTIQGKVDLLFQVPFLWKAGENDPRLLGIGIMNIKLDLKSYVLDFGKRVFRKMFKE